MRERETCPFRAALCIEGALAEDDLLGDDGEAVDVSLLGDTLLPQVLRGRPQVWPGAGPHSEEEEEEEEEEG